MSPVVHYLFPDSEVRSIGEARGNRKKSAGGLEANSLETGSLGFFTKRDEQAGNWDMRVLRISHHQQEGIGVLQISKWGVCHVDLVVLLASKKKKG